jgi:hypothetical protein
MERIQLPFRRVFEREYTSLGPCFENNRIIVEIQPCCTLLLPFPYFVDATNVPLVQLMLYLGCSNLLVDVNGDCNRVGRMMVLSSVWKDEGGDTGVVNDDDDDEERDVVDEDRDKDGIIVLLQCP